MQVRVYGRAEIEKGIVIPGSYSVISIRDPGTRVPRIRRSAGFRAAIYLEFHDAIPAAAAFGSPLRLMCDADAQLIWNFVREQANRVDYLVVHCEQGMSRSPAVAAAICSRWGGDPSRFFREYALNRYVYDLLLATA